MHVYALPGLLSPTECEAAVALFPPSRNAVVNEPAGAMAAPVARPSIRRGRASFLTSMSTAGDVLSKRMNAILRHANDLAFHFDVSAVEPFQLATYDAGDEYRWHLDVGPGAAAKRKLSASVQLSDPRDYDGGDLEVWGAAPTDRAQGSVLIFPSYMLHKVTPVTRGRRLALVAWAAGEAPFR